MCFLKTKFFCLVSLRKPFIINLFLSSSMWKHIKHRYVYIKHIFAQYKHRHVNIIVSTLNEAELYDKRKNVFKTSYFSSDNSTQFLSNIFQITLIGDITIIPNNIYVHDLVTISRKWSVSASCLLSVTIIHGYQHTWYTSSWRFLITLLAICTLRLIIPKNAISIDTRTLLGL